eukprot:gene17981-8130_t
MSVLSILAVATATGAFTFQGPPPRASVSAENDATALLRAVAASRDVMFYSAMSSSRYNSTPRDTKSRDFAPKTKAADNDLNGARLALFEFVFTAQDVAFDVADSTKSTTVLKMRQDVDAIGKDLEAMLDDLAAVDRDLLAKVAAINADTQQLKVDIDGEMKDFIEASNKWSADLTNTFETTLGDLVTTHETTLAQMTADYTKKMDAALASTSSITDKWDEEDVKVQALTQGKLDNLQKDYSTKVATTVGQSGIVAKLAADHQKVFDTKFDAQQVIWIGGMRSTMGGGWETMRFDRIELDASGDYFDIHNQYFQIKKPGIYRINFHSIMY